MTIFPGPLPDVQSELPPIPLPLNLVGVAGLAAWLTEPSCPRQLLATVDLGVDLAANQRGIHMSRLVECLKAWRGILAADAINELLQTLQNSLQADCARASFHFDWPQTKQSPIGGAQALMTYAGKIIACRQRDATTFIVGLEVPVMTVCPCSLAISRIGAHSQRAYARLLAAGRELFALEKLLEIAENSASAPVFPLLKREDEKAVTELAFANPAFVEDAVRKAAVALAAQENIEAWEARVKSMESIHGHNAFARAASPNWRRYEHLIHD